MNDAAVKMEDHNLQNDELWREVEQHPHETEKLQWELRRIGYRLKTTSPLTPYNFFSMNSSALLTAFATALTYMVVLLQFKASEAGLYDSASQNSTSA